MKKNNEYILQHLHASLNTSMSTSALILVQVSDRNTLFWQYRYTK